MVTLIIRHKVKDYPAWKRAFDTHEERKSAGLANERVTCSIDDPNEVVLLFEVTDLDKARMFCASDDLKAAMQGAGVSDKPDLYFVKDAV